MIRNPCIRNNLDILFVQLDALHEDEALDMILDFSTLVARKKKSQLRLNDYRNGNRRTLSYTEWQKLGYQVQRGEKAHTFEKEEALFHRSQVCSCTRNQRG